MRSSAQAGGGLPQLVGRFALPLLLLLYLLAAPIVNPAGDFPLNDDWSFAAAARGLALGHDWRPSGWAGMTLITQSVWAAPFCIFSSCSYEALRVANLFAGALLLVTSYFLFVHVTKSTVTAGFAAATVAFNPVLFELSYTFMTDVLFAALLTASALVFLKTLRNDSNYLFAGACLLAVAATLCRQLGLCVPIAYMAVNLIRPGTWTRKIPKSVVPVISCLMAFILFEQWMKTTGRLPTLQNARLQEISHNLSDLRYLVQRVSFNLTTVLLYLGLFCAPLLMLRRAPTGREGTALLQRAPTAIAVLAVALVTVAILWIKPGLMPIGNNVLIPQGLGPLTLRDAYFLGLNSVPPLPIYFWIAVTVVSLFGLFRIVEFVITFAARAFDRDFRDRDTWIECSFGLVCAATYFTPLLLTTLFDRYIAAIVPIFCLFILAFPQSTPVVYRSARIMAGVIFACFGIYAISGTHDYLSWNRARWQAIDDLQRTENANPDNIDGGFEFNGSTSYDADFQPREGKSTWWVKDDTYQITFGPVAGMAELRRYKYTTYLPPDTRYIHVLRRPADGREDTKSGQ